eukprot:jgi/Chlat1/6317/Chrsp44S05886
MANRLKAWSMPNALRNRTAFPTVKTEPGAHRERTHVAAEAVHDNLPNQQHDGREPEEPLPRQPPPAHHEAARPSRPRQEQRQVEDFPKLIGIAEKLMQEQSHARIEIHMLVRYRLDLCTTCCMRMTITASNYYVASQRRKLQTEQEVRQALELQLDDVHQQHNLVKAKLAADAKRWASLETQLASTGAVLDSTSTTVIALQQQLEKGEEHKSVLEDTLEERLNEFEALKLRMQELAASKDGADERVAALHLENDRLTNEIVELQQLITHFKDSLEKSNAAADRALSKHCDAEQLVASRTRDCDAAKAQLAACEKELLDSNERLRALEREKADLAGKLLALESVHRVLQTSMGAASSELISLQKKNSQLRSKVSELQDANDIANSANAALRDEVSAMTEKYEAERGKLEKSEQQAEHLEDNIHTLKTDKATLQKQIEDTRALFEHAQTTASEAAAAASLQLKAKQAEVNKLAVKVAEAELEKEALEEHCRSASVSLLETQEKVSADLEVTRRKHAGEVESLAAELKKAKASLHEAGNQQHRLEASSAQLTAQLQELLKAKSIADEHVKELSERLEQVQQQHIEATAARGEALAELQRAQQQKDEKETSLVAEYQKKIIAIAKQNEKELTQLRKKLEANSEKEILAKEKAEKALSEARDALGTERTRAAKLQDELHTLHSRHDNQVNVLKKQVEELSLHVKDLQSEKRRLVKDLQDRLKQARKEWQAEHAAAMSELTKLHNQSIADRKAAGNNTMQSQVAHLEEEISVLRAANQMDKEEYKVQLRELAEMHTARTAAQQARAEELQQQLAAAKQEHAAQVSRAEELQQKLAAAQQDHERILNDVVSKHITAPPELHARQTASQAIMAAEHVDIMHSQAGTEQRAEIDVLQIAAMYSQQAEPEVPSPASKKRNREKVSVPAEVSDISDEEGAQKLTSTPPPVQATRRNPRRKPTSARNTTAVPAKRRLLEDDSQRAEKEVSVLGRMAPAVKQFRGRPRTESREVTSSEYQVAASDGTKTLTKKKTSRKTITYNIKASPVAKHSPKGQAGKTRRSSPTRELFGSGSLDPYAYSQDQA